MMKCKDCVHYELCKYNTYQQAHYFGKDKEIYITIDNNTPCKFFKNKADVVEVVRCKDCKHYSREQCYHDRHEHHAQSIFQNADDFCSYGERK